MATYVIGDLHGCFESLEALWRQLPFEAARDHLWLTGDLVNRGPASLATLRWARRQDEALGDRFVTVLGNHDLHLLAVAAGRAEPRRRATLNEILAAPDRDELLTWLASRPLLHRQPPFLLVHAGLPPAWSLEEAEDYARELEAAMTAPGGERLWQRRPPATASAQDRQRRRRLDAFTLLRTCTAEGELCRSFSGPPAEAPPGCRPWFERRRDPGTTVVFGHWAALGLYRDSGRLGLDGGCVWGGRLLAARLDDGTVFEQPALETPQP